MAHTHSHEHLHSNEAAGSENRMLFALLLTGGFMIVEVIGGLWTGSLALLSDAGHMLTDTAALLLAWLAARTARKPADRLRSYGYHRLQIIAAFTNGIGFILIVTWIIYEAIHRLLQPAPILGGPMLAVATVGLLVNVAAFFILHDKHSRDLNVRAALVHVLGDILGSIAAIAAAAIIYFTGWLPIDAILAMAVALIILRSAWYVVRHSVHILLEGTPDDVDVKQLHDDLIGEIPDITDVHHVHVWSLTPERHLLTMHVTVCSMDEYEQNLLRIKALLKQRYGIEHSTIQVEATQCVE